jgi:hypothetical protein
VGGAGERRADLVVSGVPEHGSDVRVRADDPDLARVGTERAVGVDLVEAEHLDRAGQGGGGRPCGIGIRARCHQQQEPVSRDLPESPRGS